MIHPSIKLDDVERLDNDTVEKGLDGPYEYYEHDHTALVHVLWSARRRGLTLKDDPDAIAEMILCSRWLAARNARAVETFRDEQDGLHVDD